MASAMELTASRHPNRILGIPARLAIRADKRVISVDVSGAGFDRSGFRPGLRKTKLRLPGQQMAVAAQHPYRVAAP